MDTARALGSDRQALSLQTGAEHQHAAGARARRLEFSSRGDRVPALLLVPDGSGPNPVVVLVHAAGSGREGASASLGAPICAAGLALLAVDLPLHGERCSAKLSAHLLAALEARGANANAASLLRQFALQCQSDLRSALDAVAMLPELDAGRIGLLGIGHGGPIAAALAANDDRARAIAICEPPPSPLPSALDPGDIIDRIEPRPCRQIDSLGDGRAVASFLRDALT